MLGSQKAEPIKLAGRALIDDGQMICGYVITHVTKERMTAAGELRCLDSAIASVTKEIDSALILKDEQRTAIKAFVDRKDVCRPSYGIRQKFNYSKYTWLVVVLTLLIE